MYVLELLHVTGRLGFLTDLDVLMSIFFGFGIWFLSTLGYRELLEAAELWSSCGILSIMQLKNMIPGDLEHLLCLAASIGILSEGEE